MNKTAVRWITSLILAIQAAWVIGCGQHRPSPYEPRSSEFRDTEKAQLLNHQAVALVDSDPAKAESLLREALTADLYYGPAHNNLGALYLKQGKLYEASGEFEWAKKLMPGHPNPRLNLGLVLEEAGHTTDAISTYATALEVYPNHMPTMQAMAQLQVRSGQTDDRTKPLLTEISLRGETDEWRSWAVRQQTRLEQ